MVVIELDIKGARNFVVSETDHISGGKPLFDSKRKPAGILLEAGKIVQVKEACGKDLAESHPRDVRVIRKITKKDKE